MQGREQGFPTFRRMETLRPAHFFTTETTSFKELNYLHMKSFIRYTGLLLLFVITAGSGIAQLSRSQPEAQGVDPAAISRFVTAVNNSKNELHSFMLVKNGHIIAESWWTPYAPELKHTMYSVSKSFTSTAIGLAVSEGRLKLTDKVVSFFPELTPDTAGALLRSMTVRDLITMSAGQSPDPTGLMLRQQEWVKFFLRLPVADAPGSKFLYNSAATFMLSAILQKVTGEKLIDYLRPRLFDPLEIYNIDWELNPEGVNAGGWGLRLKTEDMAKFGQLYLQKGQWKGTQVLPAAWVEEATRFAIANSHDTAVHAKATSDWAQGYCYQFWRSRNNAYRADGAFGQYIIVIPDHQAVVAITSETPDMQHVMNLVWEHLLPALKEGETAIDKQSRKILQKQLKNQAIPVSTSGMSPVVSSVSGKNFVLEANNEGIKEIGFRFKKKRAVITIGNGEFTDELALKKGRWTYGGVHKRGPSLTGTIPPFEGTPVFKVAAAYGWKDEHTLLLNIRYVESPHTETFVCTFDKNNLLLRVDNSLKGMAGTNDQNKIIRGSLE